LAIELAAARAPALGIEALASRLDDRFRLLTGGRRTALPRHQALRATLDWSHELLAEPERVILRRLSIFAGAFSLEAASTVAASPELAPSEVVDGLSSLIAKSLVMAEVDGDAARYRLLDTTRAYALEKLAETGERERDARRHAEYYRDLFERAEGEWETRPTAEWLENYGWRIDNLRVALDWAFSPNGDVAVGVAITVAAIPLWMRLSLLGECHKGVDQALAALRAGANWDIRQEMKLQLALGISLRIRGAGDPEVGAACTKALEIAESLEDAEYQLRALWSLWSGNVHSGQIRVALALAQRFCTIAAKRPERMLGERMMGVTRHFLGDQIGARRHLEHVLTRYATIHPGRDFIRFQDVARFGTVRLSARVYLARVLWVQGFPDQAVHLAEASLGEAQATGHAVSRGRRA
jgi:hypothetical protein